MKKRIALFAALVMTLVMAVSCAKNDNLYEESNFDNVSAFIPEDVSDPDPEISHEPTTGEIVYKDKTYVYGEKKIVIVSVENNTNKDYAITVCGNFLDADGKVIDSEEKTFDQYSAGYKGNFMFESDTDFADFSCTVKTEKANASLYAKDVTVKFHGLEENLNVHMDWDAFEAGDHNKYPTLEARFSAAYSGQTDELKVCVLWVIINEKEEIPDIFVKIHRPQVGGNENHQNIQIVQAYEGELVYPEEWKGDIRAIPVIELITNNEEEMHIWAAKCQY